MSFFFFFFLFFFFFFFFFFNDTATTEIYTVYNTLSLHDALPISVVLGGRVRPERDLAGLDRVRRDPLLERDVELGDVGHADAPVGLRGRRREGGGEAQAPHDRRRRRDHHRVAADPRAVGDVHGHALVVLLDRERGRAQPQLAVQL